MNKKLLLSSIIFGIYFMVNNVFATVGGPTYISEIAFNAVNNSVYYKVHDGGGRGCPPIIHKIDFATLKDSEVKSCDEIHNQPSAYYSDSEYGLGTYNQFMSDFYQNLSYLGSVSLNKNDIDIKVEFLKENKLEGEDNWIISRDFRATFTQDSKKIGEINFKGCAKDQPHVFEGYIIPNSDKMAVLISNKSDCFEGGYIGEDLYIVRGVKYYDTNIVRSFKTVSATEPNMGNAVVYATTGESVQPNDVSPIENNANTENSSKNYYFIGAIVLGLLLGYFFGRRVKK